MSAASPSSQPNAAPLGEEALVEYRLDFAQAALANTQELIRFMDEKAGFVLAAIGILTAAVGTLAAKAFATGAHAAWARELRLGAGVLSLVYLLLAFAVIYEATQVYAARAHLLRRDSQSPGLLFPLRLLAQFRRDEDLYWRRLASASPEELLHDYANSMMETANIYRLKQANINRCVAFFRWLCPLWLATMLALLILCV